MNKGIVYKLGWEELPMLPVCQFTEFLAHFKQIFFYISATLYSICVWLPQDTRVLNPACRSTRNRVLDRRQWDIWYKLHTWYSTLCQWFPNFFLLGPFFRFWTLRGPFTTCMHLCDLPVIADGLPGPQFGNHCSMLYVIHWESETGSTSGCGEVDLIDFFQVMSRERCHITGEISTMGTVNLEKLIGNLTNNLLEILVYYKISSVKAFLKLIWFKWQGKPKPLTNTLFLKTVLSSNSNPIDPTPNHMGKYGKWKSQYGENHENLLATWHHCFKSLDFARCSDFRENIIMDGGI